jgi:hypothetical protein
MTPEDRRAAREALEGGRLSIAQVEELKAEVEKSGRPFVDLARSRGLLPPEPAARRLLFPAVFGLIGLILLGLLAYTVRRAVVDLGREAGDLDENARFRIETERRSYQARKDFEAGVVARDEAQAKAALEKGRAALRAAEDVAARGAKPPVETLNEAVVGISAWLDRHPDDVDVLLERARACELRRFLDRALADLEKASSLRPSLAPQLAPRLEAIRAQLPK